MKIDQYIHDLLEKEGQVNLPLIGTIYRREKPASFDPSGKNLLPPSLEIGFKQDLKLKDDSLAKYIASEAAISRSESDELIQQYIGEVREKLKSRKKFNIENVGLLYISSRRLHFRASGESEVLKDHPLPKVPVTPASKVAGSGSEKQGPKRKKRVRVGKVSRWDVFIPLILLLVIAGILIYIAINPQKIGIFNYAYSGWVPFHEYSSELPPAKPPVIRPQEAAASEEREIISADEETGKAPVQKEETQVEEEAAGEREVQAGESKVKEEISREPEKKTAEEKPPKKVPEPVKETVTAARTGKYHIIISSLEYRTMAEVHAERLKKKGHHAEVLGPFENGNYRVSIESYKNKEEALRRLEFIRQDVNPGAWLLKY